VLVKIVYDITTTRDDLQSDWGFAAVIEVGGNRILFDTGADGKILMDNLLLLGIDPGTIRDVFLSHHHLDHTGGLTTFLRANANVRVIAPQSLRGVRRASEILHVGSALTEIGPNLYSTGELSGIEQALLIVLPKGVVVLVGCAHPGLGLVLQRAASVGKIHAVIGGFHGFNQYELLKAVDIIVPTHCTEHQAEIETLYGDRCRRGGVGSFIEI